MTEFNDLMQKWVNTDYPVLVDLAKEAVRRLQAPCRQVDPQNNGHVMLSAIILSAVCADGTVTALEQKMLKDVLGLDDTQMRQLIKSYNPEYPGLTDYFCDNMGQDIMADTTMLVISFCAVDEKISKEETDLIKKLMQKTE